MKKIVLFILLCISLSLNAGPLQDAAEKGDNQTIKALLSEGTPVDMQDNNSQTALMWAARNGHTEIVSMLLAHNASVDMQNNGGWTALIWAADKGHTEIVSMLLAHNASVDMQNNGGWTALMWAACEGHTEIVSMLLAHKASVDMQDNGGWTALMPAAWKGHTEIVGLLVDAGASPFIRDKDDRNAIQTARDISPSVFTTGRAKYLGNKKKQLDDEKNRREHCLLVLQRKDPEAPLSVLPTELLGMIAERTLERGYEQLERDQQEWNEYTAALAVNNA